MSPGNLQLQKFLEAYSNDSGEVALVLPSEESLNSDPAEGLEKNNERSESAAAVLLHFMELTGAEPSKAISDLMSNMMHLADRMGCNLSDEIRTARHHYLQETSVKPFERCRMRLSRPTGG
jgi:hypothetical protein